MIFLGQINNQDILAKILIYRSPLDKPPLRRWGLLCHFYDKDKIGQTIEGLDKSRGEGFHLFPSPYQVSTEDICVIRATKFLEKLGFTRKV
jgi:hypothetical protein